MITHSVSSSINGLEIGSLIHSGSSSSFDRRTDERAAEMSAKSISEADKSCNMRMGLCHSISAPSDAEDVKSPLNYGRYSITVAGFWGVLNWQAQNN